MTPEQIAQRITAKWPNLHMECELTDLETDIADAIRQAIKDEREACVKVARSHECGGDDDIICQGKNCGTCITGAIRERQ